MNNETKEIPYDSTQDTMNHINRVRELMTEMAVGLLVRGHAHDRSKLESPEKEAFDLTTPKLRDLKYGSDEYRAALADIKPALEHHYKVNSHHPEHHVRGVSDMTLLDVLEMLCDWKAAGERHEGGTMAKSLAHNFERFRLSPQLYDILVRTAYYAGWISNQEVRDITRDLYGITSPARS